MNLKYGGNNRFRIQTVADIKKEKWFDIYNLIQINDNWFDFGKLLSFILYSTNLKMLQTKPLQLLHVFLHRRLFVRCLTELFSSSDSLKNDTTPLSLNAQTLIRRSKWNGFILYFLLFLIKFLAKIDLQFFGRRLETKNCWFSHDVTKIQTSELLILLRFYFHDVLEQLKTNRHTNFHSEWVLGLVIDYAWISKLLRDVAFTWQAKELWCWFKKWLISGNSAIWTVLVLE